MPYSTSEDISSQMSNLDIIDDSLDQHFLDSHQSDYTFSTESNSISDHITKSYMATDNLSALDIENSWIADSGANKHMSHNFQWFNSYKPLPSSTSWPVTAIAGNQCYVAGTGTIKSSCPITPQGGHSPSARCLVCSRSPM